MVLIIVILFAGISLSVPSFLNFRNISNIIVQISSTGLMAIGLTFVIITGGIDLSLPTVMAMSAIFGCQVMARTQNVFLGTVLIILIGAFVGAVNGFSVAKLRMVPMIATLAISTIASGVSNFYTEAKSISGMPESFRNIFGGDLFGIPVPAIILIVCAIVMHMLLSRTIFGRSVYAVGVNEKVAKINGVKTAQIIILCYVISGSMAGLAGVVASARLNAAGPAMGPQTMFLDIVCAVVLGGASVYGGKGKVVGTIIGSIFIAILSNVMNLLNIEFFITLIIKGGLIVLVTCLDMMRNRMKVG